MYKLGFIGGSIYSIAGYPHFIASQMDKKFEVVTACFSSDSEVNKQTGNELGIDNLYNNWKELITNEKDNLDAVVVLLPTPMHKEVILELLKLKIPIICEKAMVDSLEDAKEIEAIYDKNKHFLIISNNYSGYPMVRELKKRIENKELGDILSVRLKMPQESFLRPPKSVKYPQKWRLKDGFIPMISLDLGAHLHHLSNFLLNMEPIEILAEYNSFSKYGVIDDVNMLLKYENGMSGNFWLSKTSLGNRNGLHIEIYGSKASASWHQENPEYLEMAYTDGTKLTIDRGSNINIQNQLYNRMTPGHPSGFIEAFANLYSDIYECLEAFKNDKNINSEYVYGVEHAINGIELLHTASLSNKNKTWTKVI